MVSCKAQEPSTEASGGCKAPAGLPNLGAIGRICWVWIGLYRVFNIFISLDDPTGGQCDIHRGGVDIAGPVHLYVTSGLASHSGAPCLGPAIGHDLKLHRFGIRASGAISGQSLLIARSGNFWPFSLYGPQRSDQFYPPKPTCPQLGRGHQPLHRCLCGGADPWTLCRGTIGRSGR